MRAGVFLLPVFVMLMATIVAIACGGSAAAPPEQEESGETPPTAGEALVIEVKEGGVPTQILPEVIEVKKGSTIVIRFSGLDDEAHTFTANSLGIDLEIAGRETKETRPVTIEETDTIFFFCRFHRGIGGAGSIKVTD